jgi:hypothetical protein
VFSRLLMMFSRLFGHGILQLVVNGHLIGSRSPLALSSHPGPAPSDLGLTPSAKGASVWAWQGGQTATSRSRSKSEPSWVRLTTWWTSTEPEPLGPAWEQTKRHDDGGDHEDELAQGFHGPRTQEAAFPRASL